MASQVESIKWVPGTRFIVDGFRFPSKHCLAYFLTHAHSDHTTGLSRSWDAGLIYCSAITARLLQLDFGLPPSRLRILPMDQPTTVAGVEVTALDANHCPGAIMLLFRIPEAPACVPTGSPPGTGAGGSVVLHTGDFRWHPSMAEHPALVGQQIHCLMLDTTYSQPKWCFPPQDEVVAQLAELMRAEAEEHPRTLFLISAYHIGKERCYLGAAAALGWRVWAPPSKRRLLRQLGLPAPWLALLAEAPEGARVHVAGAGDQMHPQALAERLAAGGEGGQSRPWDRIFAVRATGWTWRRSGQLDLRREGAVTILGLPYSEHSSYEELRDCVARLRPQRLVPTVNAGDAAAARAIVDCFAGLMDLSADRSRLDHYFLKEGSSVGDSKASAGSAACSSAAGSKRATSMRSDGSSPPLPSGSAALGSASRLERGLQSEEGGQERQACMDGGAVEHSASGWAGAGGQGCSPLPQTLPARQQQRQQHLPSSQAEGQGQALEEAGDGRDVGVDLAAVDVEEQRRILAALERERLHQQRHAQQAAAGAAQHRKRQGAPGSAGCVGGRSGGRSAGKQLKQGSLQSFLQGSGAAVAQQEGAAAGASDSG